MNVVVELVVSDPEILGGKPVIKGTRMPVSLIFELAGLNYTVDQILEWYPFLNRDIIVQILKMGKELKESLDHVNFSKYINEEILEK
ncbi:MAG: hypothetical protein RBG13Loki_3048 [Promethearchaeota archaeon CR_4]|nr:MAG: hypothetical protein RBG13Loki_3048 [Candidatus Lokiarchaeota archaeon CR_4]